MTTSPGTEIPPPPRFEVERELGRGGMGVVWLVRDRARGGERVALKRLNPEFDPEMLRREFAAARRLRHPVIVAARDYGVDAEGAFLTMEYVDGDDLTVHAGKVGPERVARWALLLADALEHARRRGLVHGDLKPQNVFVPRADPDAVRLLDLGLVAVTGARLAGGTPAYLAPELLAGKPADARSDLWALGCVLYECLSGHPPYQGIERRAPLPALPVGVPERLRAVIAALLRPRPDERPGRPADLMLMLGDVPGLRLPLPEGDFVGRETILREIVPGGVLMVEAEPGMGATRLLREIAENADAAGHHVVTLDADEAYGETTESLLVRARDGAVVAVVRPGAGPSAEEVQRVTLPPLMAEEMKLLVASRLPLEERTGRAVAAWAHSESGGSPALAIAALEALRDSGLLRPGAMGLECEVEALDGVRPEHAPAGRAAAVTAGLDPDLRERAAVAAVLGPSPEDEPDLARAGLVARDAAGLPQFRSDSVRRALEATLGDERRRALHSEAAVRQAAASAPDAAAVARHLLAAGFDGEAAVWLVRAAAAARARGDRRDVRRCLALAVDRLAPGRERARARLDLAIELRAAREHEPPLALLAAVRAESPELSAEAWLEEAELRAARNDPGLARAAADEALRLVPEAGASRLRAGALFVLGRLAAQGHDLAEARERFVEAHDLFRVLGNASGIARSANAIGNIELVEKRFEGALLSYRDALAAARSAGDKRLIAVALGSLARTLVERSPSSAETRAVVQEALMLAEAEGDAARIAQGLLLVAIAEEFVGNCDVAMRHLDRSIAQFERVGIASAAAHPRLRRGGLLTTLGRFEEARQELESVRFSVRGLGEHVLEAASLEELGRLALERRQIGLAKEWLDQALQVASAAGLATKEWSALALLAEVHGTDGAFAAAGDALSRIPSEAGDDLVTAARMARAEAAVLASMQRLPEAHARLESMAARLREASLQVELALTLLAIAPIMSSLRRQGEALAVLAEAEEIFSRFGARPALARTILAKAKIKGSLW